MEIRDARSDDLLSLVDLIIELEEGRDLPVVVTEEVLSRDLLSEGAVVHAIVAEDAGEVVGCAMWSLTYSSRTGRHRAYMSDLCVTRSRRGLGIGRTLVAALAARCEQEGWERLEWRTLADNPAHRFYERLGAVPLDGRTTFVLTPGALAEGDGGGTGI